MKENSQEQRAVLTQLDKNNEELYHSAAVHFGISDTAFWILYCLCESDEIYTQNSLAELWCFPKQTINSAISNLVKAGYVRLEQLAGARNSKAIRLTEKGSGFCQDTIIPLLNAEQRAFSRMTEDERKTFVALSGKYHLFLKEEFNKLYHNKE